ncbi:MAG TPA: EamA family transporter [Balneolales bacterium]|nr:EamA family transporter [Balneolales bacterium]
MSNSTGKATPLTKGPLIAFAVLAMVWGYNWVFMKIAMRYCSPMYFALMRVGGGAIFLFVIVLFMGRPIWPKYPGRVLLLGLLQTTCYLGLISWAVAHGEASKSAVFAYSMPFWVILLSWPLLGERVKGFQWLAVAMAFLGLVLIVKPWVINAGLEDNLLGILAGFAWGGSVIVFKKIPTSGMKDLISVTTWQMIFGLPILALAAFSIHEPPIQWNPVLIGAIVYNVIAATVVAWVLWYYLLQKLPANVSSLSVLIVPVVGVVAAWIQLGEQPGPIVGTGMICMVIALGITAVTNKG